CAVSPRRAQSRPDRHHGLRPARPQWADALLAGPDRGAQLSHEQHDPARSDRRRDPLAERGVDAFERPPPCTKGPYPPVAERVRLRLVASEAEGPMRSVQLIGLGMAALFTTAAVAASDKAADIERGRYLVKIADCNGCHTPGFPESGGKTPEA